MSENKKIKNPIASYSILLGIMLVVFAVLAIVAYYDHSSWSEGLKKQLTLGLQEKYEMGEMIDLEGAISTSVAACNITEKSGGRKSIAVITKVTTIYGPIPGIFIYDLENESCSFEKYLTLGGVALRQITANTENSQIQYWKGHIPSLLRNCGVLEVK